MQLKQGLSFRWQVEVILMGVGALALLNGSSADNGIKREMSIECFSLRAASIGAYRVDKVTSATPGEAKFTEIAIQTKRVKAIKGDPPGRVDFSRMWMMSARKGEPQSRPEPGEEYLIFFDAKEKQEHTVNLTWPATSRHAGIVFSEHFKVLRTKQEILETVGAVLKTRAGSTESFRRVQIPRDSEAYSLLDADTDGNRYLLVP